MKPIYEAIEDRFFSNYDEEQEMVRASLSCLKLVDFDKILDKYGEDKVFEVLCTQFRTNVNPQLIFSHLKSLPVGIDFI